MINSLKTKKESAFTLVELMVTVAILGLLLTIAYPSYSNYLVKTRRVEAQQTLYILAKDMEQYYAQHQNYMGANLVVLSSKTVLGNEYYRFDIRELTAQSYQLAAIPVQKQDKLCATLTLDQLGDEDSTGTGAYRDCWLT